VPLPSGRRLDALSFDGRWATEVELSSDFGRLMIAARRLSESGAAQKVLRVPRRDMRMAAAALRHSGVSAWVRDVNWSDEFFVRCY
jgi:hypothetical protein